MSLKALEYRLQMGWSKPCHWLSPIQMGKAFDPQGCCDRSAHLVGHREEGFAFWGRLIGYLLQDHGNGLICSSRVFSLQQ